MFMIPAAAVDIPQSIVGIIITGVFGVIIGIIGAIMARRGAKLGSRENRAPNVQEMWAQQESDRRMRQLVEDIWWGLRTAFQTYYRRVTSTVSKMNLDEKTAKAFELTPSEKKFINQELPPEP